MSVQQQNATESIDLPTTEEPSTWKDYHNQKLNDAFDERVSDRRFIDVEEPRESGRVLGPNEHSEIERDSDKRSSAVTVINYGKRTSNYNPDETLEDKHPKYNKRYSKWHYLSKYQDGWGESDYKERNHKEGDKYVVRALGKEIGLPEHILRRAEGIITDTDLSHVGNEDTRNHKVHLAALCLVNDTYFESREHRDYLPPVFGKCHDERERPKPTTEMKDFWELADERGIDSDTLERLCDTLKEHSDFPT